MYESCPIWMSHVTFEEDYFGSVVYGTETPAYVRVMSHKSAIYLQCVAVFCSVLLCVAVRCSAAYV